MYQLLKIKLVEKILLGMSVMDGLFAMCTLVDDDGDAKMESAVGAGCC